MGERCYVNIKCPKLQVDQLCDILGAEPEISGNWGDGWQSMSFEECNYALEEERKDAASKGLVFLGHHGPVQGAYPGALFASNGDGQLYQVVHMDDDDLTPVVPLTTELSVCTTALKQVRKAYGAYLDLLEEARGHSEPDFGEMLEARLDCLNNEAIIDELGLHDPEQVGMLLDYIRIKKGG